MAAEASCIVLGCSVAILWFGNAAGASPKFCVDSSALAYTYKEVVLTSPNYPDVYPNNMSCRLSISTGSTDLCVKIDVIHIDLQSCEYGSLSYYNGWSGDHKVVRRMCGINRRNEPVIFKSSSVTVYFKSDESFVGYGFKLKYSAVFCEGHLLDISSPVTATASSAYVSSSGLEFAPHLAVQPDTGHMWSTCFVSNKELHPWFTLEFRSVTNIFNLRLGVRSLVGGQLPKDFNLSGMDKLSVYVSNSSALKSSSKQLCGSSWNYTHTKNIVLDCGENLKGRYLHIIVPSTSPTYLMICFIVVNRENGPPFPLNMSDARATVVSSGSDSNRPPVLVIDGNSTSCSSFTGATRTWLRVDIQTIRYITEVQLLFNERSGVGVKVYVGRGLRVNGLHDNTRCRPVSNASNGLQSMNFTCRLPALGQFIYIEKEANEMQLCEIKVFYDNILNMYSLVNITASDQFTPNNSIWKPVDGEHAPLDEVSWRSLSSSKSWWRMEFPHRSRISGVVIYPPGSTKGDKMNGFAVYVGDSPVGNGSKNAMCGKPWRETVTSVITIRCRTLPVGKYLYVSAADRPGATVFLSEISFFTCQEPSAVITEKQIPQSDVFLTCQGTRSGCAVTNAAWVGQDGNKINAIWEHNYNLSGSPISSILVNSSIPGKPYTCKINYTGGSAIKVYPERVATELVTTETPTTENVTTRPPTTETPSTEPLTNATIIKCSEVVYRCFLDPSCLQIIANVALLFECAEILETPPGSPPHCTEDCREHLIAFFNTDPGSDILHCDCASIPPESPFGPLCRPFQEKALPKCNVTLSNQGPVTTKSTTTENVIRKASPSTTEVITTETPTNENFTTEASTAEAISTETPTTERVTTEVSTTEHGTTVEYATTEAISTETPTTGRGTTEVSTTEYVTTEGTNTAECVTAQTPAIEAAPIVTTDGFKMHCMFVIMTCAEDPSCLEALLNPLLLECAEVLRTPPGSTPCCTEGCRDLVRASFNTGLGSELLNCDCANPEEIPLFGPLCRPFQQNALVKCNVTLEENLTTETPFHY